MGREGHFVLTEHPLGEQSSWGHLPSGVGMAGDFPASQRRWQLRGDPHGRPAFSPQGERRGPGQAEAVPELRGSQC